MFLYEYSTWANLIVNNIMFTKHTGQGGQEWSK